jgi:hypothetical protein
MIQSKVPVTDHSNFDLEDAALNRREAFEFNKRGLFIGGCPKSGTTLLMSLLDNHPQLVVLPEETSYLEDRPQYRALKSYPARLRHLLEKTGLQLLARGWREPVLYCDSPDARTYGNFDYDHFVALAQSFINRPWINDSLLFSEVVRAYGTVLGTGCRNCTRWVEKTPRTESHLRALNELFPEAKLIQIIRDPRAVFASVKNRIMSQYGSHTKAHRLVRSWNRSAREIPQLLQDPFRFLVVRYEDLVRTPRKVLETICRFGGFDFSENMLEPTRAGNGWQGNSAFHKTFSGISTASLDQWKDTLTEEEVWWVEMHCRKGMKLANYSFQTRAHFSWSRWLKRLPGESLWGYLRGRRGSLCQRAGLLKECRYRIPFAVLKAIRAENYFPQLP